MLGIIEITLKETYPNATDNKVIMLKESFIFSNSTQVKVMLLQ